MKLSIKQARQIKNLVANICFGTFGHQDDKDYWKGADIQQRFDLNTLITKIRGEVSND